MTKGEWAEPGEAELGGADPEESLGLSPVSQTEPPPQDEAFLEVNARLVD